MKETKIQRMLLALPLLIILSVSLAVISAMHDKKQNNKEEAYIDVCENGPVQLTSYFDGESFSIEMESNESYEFDGSRIDSVVIEPLNYRTQINVNGDIIQLDNKEKFVYEPNR